MRIYLIDTAKIDPVYTRIVNRVMKWIDTTVLAEVVIHLMRWESVNDQGVRSLEEIEICSWIVSQRHNRIFPPAY